MNYKSLGININTDKCWGISWNKGEGKQCPYNKKEGNYCNKHYKCLECGNIYEIFEKPRIGKPLKEHIWNVNKKNNDSGTDDKSDIDSISSGNSSNNSIDEMLLVDSEEICDNIIADISNEIEGEESDDKIITTKFYDINNLHIKNDNKIALINGDCLDIMKKIKSKSINAIITDLPYGVSKNNWDTPLDLDIMWSLFKNILCDNGIIILTASGKFTARLMMSNIDMFKYDIIWEKTVNSGQLNVNKMPLRSHENILIFYNKHGTYNEQKTKGEPYKIKRTDTTGDGYGGQKGSEKTNDGYRHARSVIKISNPRKKGGHPTQKPVELMEYLIKAYTNEGDTVLDCCMGGGSTGIAAVKNNRHFIGIELEKTYYDVCVNDIMINVS